MANEIKRKKTVGNKNYVQISYEEDITIENQIKALEKAKENIQAQIDELKNLPTA